MKTGFNPRSFFALAYYAVVCIVSLLACAGSGKSSKPKSTVTVNLDSLNQVAEHNDSVESNVIFYEDAFKDYHKRFPDVSKSEYLRIAKGKDQSFCLFKTDPVKTCLEMGNKFNDLNLKPPARDAFHAGLLSEAYNDSTSNIKLWASMSRMALEEKDYDLGKIYLLKILAVEPKNKWAKKLMGTIPKN